MTIKKFIKLLAFKFIAGLRPYQFKGKAKLFGLMVPKSGIVDAIIHGYSIQLDLSDHIQRLVFIGAYERWETSIFRKSLKTNMCVIDVGANIGYFTLLAARLVGQNGKVIAIEPDPEAFAKLKKTVEINKITQIVLINGGLGRNVDSMFLPKAGRGNNSPSLLDRSHDSGCIINIYKLDDIVKKYGIFKCDLLKVDVEGYEPEVFAGGALSLSEGIIYAIIFEINRHWLQFLNYTPEMMLKYICSFGFRDETILPFDPQKDIDTRLLVFNNLFPDLKHQCNN